jgi:UDP:flavonoid glycosyltransferase YjiC (YdhE family)
MHNITTTATAACSSAGRSHMVPYLEVLQPLSERGHSVTVVTDKDASAWLAPNYPQFELQFVPEVVNELMHDVRRGNSSMAQEMMDPNRRGEQQDMAVEVRAEQSQPHCHRLCCQMHEGMDAQ